MDVLLNDGGVVRNLLLIASLFTIFHTLGPTSRAQNAGTFTLPNSVLLFQEDVPRPPYVELLVVSNAGVIEVPPPADYRGTAYTSVFPALSPLADRVAWGLSQHDKSRKERIKSVLGIFSIADKTWKTFGDFCGESIGWVVFSPDGTKVAFASKPAFASGDGYCFENTTVLQILDIATGKLTPIQYSGRIDANARLTWSPDGKYLAGQFCCSIPSTDQIVVIDLASNSGKAIAEGTNPSWSPKGDWISFEDQKGRECILARPDGTGAKVVQKLQDNLMLLKGAVWSPDGGKLLFDEEAIDSDGNVSILDLPSGKITKQPKHTEFVLGWASQFR